MGVNMRLLDYLRKKREERQRQKEEQGRKQAELEKKKAELEAELLRLYEEDEDFREFLKFIQFTAKARDPLSKMGFQLIATSHLRALVQRYEWDETKFEEFFKQAEANRGMILQLVQNLQK
jgi:hypothetical protein